MIVFCKKKLINLVFGSSTQEVSKTKRPSAPRQYSANKIMRRSGAIIFCPKKSNTYSKKYILPTYFANSKNFRQNAEKYFAHQNAETALQHKTMTIDAFNFPSI